MKRRFTMTSREGTKKTESQLRGANNEGTENNDRTQESRQRIYSQSSDHIRNNTSLNTNIEPSHPLLQTMTNFNWTSEGNWKTGVSKSEDSGEHRTQDSVPSLYQPEQQQIINRENNSQQEKWNALLEIARDELEDINRIDKEATIIEYKTRNTRINLEG